jgi:WD40 repeat protein
VVGTAAYTDETNIETFSGKCQIWDVETRRKVRELDVPSFIISTAWFPDGKALVIGRWDGRLSLWDGESSAPWKTMAASAERSDVNGLAWSPDRTVLASAQQDGMVRIWDPAGEVLKTFAGHTAGIRGLAWSPDGNRLASTGLDAAIWVWRVQDGQALAHLTPNALPMWALSWSPDGKWLAAGTGEYGRDIPGGSVLIYQMPQA